MGKWTHGMVHCAFTPPTLNLTREHLKEWHLAPRWVDSKNAYLYGGKYYAAREDLPDDVINGKLVRDLDGNGWSRVGYSMLFQRDGFTDIIIPWDKDDIIESWEISNGATGWNGRTKHFCLAGGKSQHSTTPENNFTTEELAACAASLKLLVMLEPDIKIIGHNQVHPTKACPSMDVRVWAREIGIPDGNIDFHKYVDNPFLS